MKNNKTPLVYSQIYIGMKVIDNYDDAGIVDSCDDIHNVNVLFESGGAGLYCLDETCEEYINHKEFNSLFLA